LNLIILIKENGDEDLSCGEIIRASDLSIEGLLTLRSPIS